MEMKWECISWFIVVDNALAKTIAKCLWNVLSIPYIYWEYLMWKAEAWVGQTQFRCILIVFHMNNGLMCACSCICFCSLMELMPNSPHLHIHVVSGNAVAVQMKVVIEWLIWRNVYIHSVWLFSTESSLMKMYFLELSI